MEHAPIEQVNVSAREHYVGCRNRVLMDDERCMSPRQSIILMINQLVYAEYKKWKTLTQETGTCYFIKYVRDAYEMKIHTRHVASGTTGTP